MIIESIILVIFVCSLGGVLLILARKMPVLITLSQNGSTGFKKHHFILEIESKVKKIIIYFEKQIFLHKFLSWVKCTIMKIEVKVDHLLHRIRRKAQETDKKK